MARTCKVWNDNVPHVKKVLEREQVAYSFSCLNDRQYLLSVNLSHRELREILKDALCEKERSSRKGDIPVYSFETMMNRPKLHRLMQLNNSNAFHILHKDYEKYLQAVD